MISENDRIFKNLPNQKELTLKSARAQGDWVGLKDLLTQKKEDLAHVIRASQIREKDASGLLVSEKWHPFTDKTVKPFLVIDASRGSPGDVGSLHLVCYETYKIIEGALLAAFIVGSERGYVYVSGDQGQAFEVMRRVVAEAYGEGILGNNVLDTGFDFHLEVHLGSSAYVGYSSDRMIDTLAGEKQPTGTLFGQPVLVHQVETVGALPTLLQKGDDWFASLGTAGSAGTKVFSFSGHVNKPCVFEERLGASFRATLENYAGGVRGGWSHLNFVFPSGIGSPLLLRSFCQDLTLSYESIASFHSFLGSGSMVVVNGSVSLLALTCSTFSFFAKTPTESCLFCAKGLPVCEGILRDLPDQPNKLQRGGEAARNLEHWVNKIEKRCQCGYASHALRPLKGYLQYAEGQTLIMPFQDYSLDQDLYAN